MKIEFNTSSVESYEMFLNVRRCPSYSFKGTAAIVPDQYAEFLGVETERTEAKPITSLESLFDYQRDIAATAITKGKYAVFADCGLGKTLILLEFARHAARATGQKVLIVSPLMVVRQTIAEAERWYGGDISIGRVDASSLNYWLSSNDSLDTQIGVTNYEAIREGLEPGSVDSRRVFDAQESLWSVGHAAD